MQLGIDFGTCYTSAALLQDNGTILLVREPLRHTNSFPSSVYLQPNGELLVGQAAENKQQLDPTRYQSQFKRDLGSQAPYQLGGTSFCPEELVAAMLRKLKQEAEQMTQGTAITAVTLTVPATYQQAKRALMEQAAQAAGFTDITLLEEPVAAARYYASHTGELFADGEIVLVYDLGGGTFDATLVHRTGGDFKFLGYPTGLADCGGADFDRAIYQDFLAHCSPQLHEILCNPEGGMQTLRARLMVAEFCRYQVKHALSEEEVVEAMLPGLAAEPYTLTRTAFNAMLAPLLSRTIGLCHGLLAGAGLTPEQIGKILLIGGSSRIPYVKDTLEKELGRPVLRVDDPELAVCQGTVTSGERMFSTAIQAASLSIVSGNDQCTHVLDALTTALRDTHDQVRKQAAITLGQIGDVRAREPLLAALHDSVNDVQVAVVRALGAIGDTRATEVLISDLNDKENAVRNFAAWALGELGDARAVEPLIVALRDDDDNVRASAADSLKKFGDARAVEPLIVVLCGDDFGVQLSAVRTLGELGDERAVKPLINTLRDDMFAYFATEALAKLGDARAVEPIISLLYKKNKNGRSLGDHAASALGKLGDKRAVEPLITALHDDDKSVRWAAASALGDLRDVQAVEPLITALHDNDAHVRLSSLFSLGSLGWDLRAVEPIIDIIMHDDDWQVRCTAASSLGKIGDVRAVKPLFSALRDDDSRVSEDAARALCKIEKAGLLASLKAILQDDNAEDIRHPNARTRDAMGKAQTVFSLLPLLREGDYKVQGNAISALAEVVYMWIVRPCIAILHDDDDRYERMYATAFLGRSEDTRALEPLIFSMRNDIDSVVRQFAALELGNFGDMALDPLICAMRDDSAKEVRCNAASALGKIGNERAIVPLIAALHDADETVRKSAVKALCQFGDPQAIKPLTVALHDEDVTVGSSAAMALCKLGSAPAIGALITALRDNNEHVRISAAEALGKIEWNTSASLHSIPSK